MPRSLRDSDEEMDTKSGRKTRGLIGSSVVDSPRRRSTRIKPFAKQNESSPDSPVSDVSTNSNTQITRVTRRRAGTMDSVTVPEKNRTLRSGRNSVSLDINEIIESEAVTATPTKKTRNAALTQSNDTLKGKTRISRAGSEAKSVSPVGRVTRRTRASSMEPESITDTMNKLKSHSEASLTPVKTRRRASMVPSQASLIEEREINKILVVTLDRTIPELNESTENGSKSKLSRKSNELLSTLNSDVNRENVDVTIIEESEEVKGLHKKSEENPSTGNFENAQNKSPDDTTLTIQSDKETVETNEKLAAEHLVENVSQASSNDNNQITPIEPQLETEHMLNTTKEEQNVNNKENQTTNIILSDTIAERSKEIKSFPSSPVAANKSMKEKPKLLGNESLSTKRRYSKELSEVSDAASPKGIRNSNDTGNDSVNLKMDTSIDKENESLENVENVIVNKEKDLVANESNENLNKSTASVEMCSNSNSLNSSTVCDETVQDKFSTDVSSHMENSKNVSETKRTVEATCSDDNVVNNDSAKEADSISDKNETENTNKDEQSKEEILSQSIEDDDSERKEKIENLDTSEKVTGKAATDGMQTLSSTNSNNVTDSKSSHISLTSTESSNILEDESIKSDLKETNNTSFVLANAVSEPSNLSSQSGDSTPTNKNADSVIDVIKCGQSSIVTDSPAEPIKESPDKEDLIKKTPPMDTSLSSRRKSRDKLKSAENEQKSDKNPEVQKENEEGMEVDDNDSDAAVGSLFQDISANEWKKKKTEKHNDNSSVHSMSTERLENESEAECDLILVDKDASSGPENVKLLKDKDSFDYDSDDTVVLKSQLDSRKTKGNEESITGKLHEDCKMDISSDEVSKTGSKRKSLAQEKSSKEEASEDLLEDADSDTFNKSSKTKVVAENLESMDGQHTSKLNVSRKSVGEKSVSKSFKVNETEEGTNESLKDLKLNKSRLSSEGNVSKKRKSLNKSNRSMQAESSGMDVEEISADENDESSGNKELGKIETTKKRKSLNKSNIKDIEENEIPEPKSNSVNTSTKKDEKNKSLNTPLKKRLKLKTVIKDLIDESDTECTQESNEETSSAKKKKLTKNHRNIVQVDSDSDDDKSNDSVASNDSEDESFKLPNFLFVRRDSSGSGSDNDDDDDKSSNKSVDSDIKREYNLDGIEITEYSDDNVRSDECRASELESSDPDDNGSDLADFIVADDEDEEASGQEAEGEEEKKDVVEEDDDEDKDLVEEGDEEEKDVAEKDEGEENEETENEGSADKEGEEDDGDDDDDDKVEKDVTEESTEEEIEDREVSKKRNNTQEDMETEELIFEERRSSMSNKKALNRSLETSKKQKTEDSVNLNLSQVTDSGKKKKKSKQNVSSVDKIENEVNSSDISVTNSFKLKKTKQKQLSNEFVEENIEQRLMDSEILPNINIQKFNKSMKCSTPKLKSSASQQFETSNIVADTTSRNSGKKSTNKANVSAEGASFIKQRIANTSLIETNITKKFKKAKDHEKSLLHKSLPTDLVELIEKTNLSRPMSSRTTELNKTTLTPTTETPKTKYLKKDKLNESAPTLESVSEFKKSRSEINIQNKPSIHEEQENVIVEEDSAEIEEETNVLMKKKVMKIADSILDTEKQKKHKKRKGSNAQKKSVSPFKGNSSQENETLETTDKKRKITAVNSATSENDVEQMIETADKKKKKKKSRGVEESITTEEESHANLSVKQSESTEETTNEGKNKKKKKKKKQNKENQNDNVDIDADTEDVISAKKNVGIKTEKIQPETVLLKKKSHEKLKVSKDGTIKSKSNKQVPKTQPSNDTVSDSDEAPEVVAFSKAREEALTVMKRTADSIRAHKEERKKRKIEHLDRVQQEKEIKMQKVATKSDSNKGNKLEVLKKGIKRLPTEVLENLSDLPPKPLKRRKFSNKEKQILPSRSMFDTEDSTITNIQVEDNFSPLSLYGSTSQFDVVNLKKIKKQKKVPIAASFRQKMLARNARQPISAYLMYLEKQKSSGNNKFCNRPF